MDFLYERGPYFPVVCNIPTTTVKMVLLPLSQTHIEESLGHILQAVKITIWVKTSFKAVELEVDKGFDHFRVCAK